MGSTEGLVPSLTGVAAVTDQHGLQEDSGHQRAPNHKPTAKKGALSTHIHILWVGMETSCMHQHSEFFTSTAVRT